MEVIVGHHGTDFDCLGAMIAAKKLYPRATCVLPGRVDRNVREFLDIYEDEFNLVRAKDIDPLEVDRVIVVDTKHAQRLGAPLSDVVRDEAVGVVIYDHHPVSAGDMTADELYNSHVGATTTMLVSEIRDREMRLTPVEATVMALGIYEDTGSLSYSTTTVEDVLAVAFLLECGADLDVVSRHTRYTLSQEQREVLNQLILSVQHVTFSGVKVAIAEASVDDYVGDVAVLTNKLAVIESVEALFTLTQVGESAYLVGRSRSDSLDVSEVLGRLGGGGHHRAASAVLKERDIGRIRQDLLQHIGECVHPPLIAKSIMSHPVRMVEETTSIDEAKKVLLRYGYSGILVGRQGAVAGVIDRKDLDKAIHHGLGHAPVKSCMNTRVAFATPDTPVPELQELLITHRVGRVPIADDEGKLVGIVTMADLRAGTHSPSGAQHRTYHGEWCGVQDEANTLRGRKEDGLADLLRELGKIADAMSVPAFLVGGGARDLLLGAPSIDVDVLIEGNAIRFAQRAADELGAKLTAHEKFVTAVMTLSDGRKIDVASARTEFYEAPAALPEVEVEHSSLKEDLYRRDFTINAMAVQINESAFGVLYDFFGGRADLERGLIRVMHSLSFVEDPTRIFRAVRFEQRLGFTIEQQTEQLLAYALESELFSALASERIRDELILMLSESDPIPAVHRMSHLGIWEHIHEKIVFDNQALDELRRTSKVLGWLSSLAGPIVPTRWLLYLCPLLRSMSATEIRDVARRLRLTREDTEQLSDSVGTVEFVLPALDSDEYVRPSHVYRLLADQSPLVIARLLVCAQPGGPGEERIMQYLSEHRGLKLTVGGAELKALGYAPGPEYGRVLHQLLAERVDGQITPEDERRRLAEIAKDVFGPVADAAPSGVR